MKPTLVCRCPARLSSFSRKSRMFFLVHSNSTSYLRESFILHLFLTSMRNVYIFAHFDQSSILKQITNTLRPIVFFHKTSKCFFIFFGPLFFILLRASPSSHAGRPSSCHTAPGRSRRFAGTYRATASADGTARPSANAPLS